MTTSRSIKRAGDRKKSKEAKKALAGIGDELSKMPKVCGECGTAFDKNDKTSLTWRIAIYDDGPVHLACPDCVPDSVKNQQ